MLIVACSAFAQDTDHLMKQYRKVKGAKYENMTKAISKNAEDIAANTKKIGEVEASIPGALSAALADYKVKNVDGTTIQLSDAGVASVKAISTDLLVQGELELVLNGGSAN